MTFSAYPLPIGVCILLVSSFAPPQAASAQVGGGRTVPLTKRELALLEQCDALDHRFERRALVYHEAALEEHLTAVSRPLLPEVLPNHVQWRFFVLREPLVYAFSLPNGTIYVSTGLLALLENDDQLAGVLAHEITHVVNGDAFQSQREYRKKETARSVGALAGLAVAGLSGAGLAAYLLLQDAGQPIPLWVTSGYGDEPEKTADQAAVDLLVRAGRDSAAMVRSLDLMSELRDPEPLTVFYTDRTKLRERSADFQRVSSKGAVSTAGGRTYLDAVQGAIRENIQMDIDSRRFRSAVAGAQRLVTAHPDDPKALCWLGEAYRSLGPRTLESSPEERSPDGHRAAVQRIMKRTAQEEDKLLAATPQGGAAMRSNRERAEELFLRAARMDTKLSAPHVGLGTLYAQQGRTSEARAEYRKYLELAPNASDRLRIETRLAALDESSGAH